MTMTPTNRLKPAQFTRIEPTKARLCLRLGHLCTSLVLNKATQEKQDDVDQRVADIWEKAQETLPDGATKLKINLSKLFISYTKADGGVVYLEDAKLGELRQKMLDLRSSISEVWKSYQYAAKDGVSSNRSLIAPAPLQVNSEKWNKLTHRSLLDLLKNSELMNRFFTNFTDADRDQALNRMVAADIFVGRIRAEVQRQIEGKTDKKDPDRKALLAFQARLEKMDRLAFLYSIAMSRKTPDEISEGMKALIEEELQPGVDTSNVILRTLGLRGSDLVVETDLNTYTREVGDTAVHDRLAQIQRRESEPEDRPEKGASIEETLYHTLCFPKQGERALLDLMGLLPNRDRLPELQKAFSREVIDYTHRVQTVALIEPNGSLQERIKGIRRALNNTEKTQKIKAQIQSLEAEVRNQEVEKAAEIDFLVRQQAERSSFYAPAVFHEGREVSPPTSPRAAPLQIFAVDEEEDSTMGSIEKIKAKYEAFKEFRLNDIATLRRAQLAF